MKKPEPAPPAQPEPLLRIVLSRDEIYRVVNSCYHSGIELSKSGAFAIRHRGHAYRNIATKLDEAYVKLIESGPFAEFDVQFNLRIKAKEEKKQ